MEDDICNLQPESEGFILVELRSGAHAIQSTCITPGMFQLWLYSAGGTTYLKAETDGRTEVEVQHLKFFVKGNP